MSMRIALLLFCISTSILTAQQIEGYVFETENRGYLNQAKVTLLARGSNKPIGTVFTNKEGFFQFESSDGLSEGVVFVEKVNFISKTVPFKVSSPKTFVKVEIEREPGYMFEATLAPIRSSEDIVVDAIRGARIEVFNNTKDIQELELRAHPDPEFRFSLKKGNHYTLMMRKEGYLTKRIEAYVDIEDCILCLDGVGDVRPEVAENMHEGNELGSLLANIELEPAKIGTKFVIENIYYDFDKSFIRSDAAEELDDLAMVLNDNPKYIIELGSHTDSRGKDKYNLKLSDERAKSAVEYLVGRGVDPDRITSKGYGETQIQNQCKNGVECTEEEHQENRRTVIKITGILDFDEMENKTLAQIIREEKFLAEAFGGEQIKITGDEELPEDLDAYLKEKELDGDLSKDEIKETLERVQGQRSLYEDLPSDFSGYTILLTDDVNELRVLRSNVALEETIFAYNNENSTLFVMGEYRRLKQVKKEWEEIRNQLPNSEVVFFRQGKMVKK